jgi:hypothetical protein
LFLCFAPSFLSCPSFLSHLCRASMCVFTLLFFIEPSSLTAPTGSKCLGICTLSNLVRLPSSCSFESFFLLLLSSSALSVSYFRTRTQPAESQESRIEARPSERSRH